MKRFLLFKGNLHEANGGWDEFICDSDSFDELEALAKSSKPNNDEWFDIVDTSSMSSVLRMFRSFYFVDGEWCSEGWQLSGEDG